MDEARCTSLRQARPSSKESIAPSLSASSHVRKRSRDNLNLLRVRSGLFSNGCCYKWGNFESCPMVRLSCDFVGTVLWNVRQNCRSRF